MSQLILYTDGACHGNPGPGGWGAYLCYGAHTRELWGGEAMTTNNRMELTAVIEGLKALKRTCQVIIYTDSQYVQKGMTLWLEGWKKQWQQGKRKSIKNQDLWKELDALAQQHQVDWQWVRGHAGNPGNEKADTLASMGMRPFLSSPPSSTVKTNKE